PVAPDDAALAGLARFDEPLPEVAGDPAGTLALLDEAGSAATMASAGGRYFGFVIGGSYPVAVAAGWLATAWDQDVALPVMSPVAAAWRCSTTSCSTRCSSGRPPTTRPWPLSPPSSGTGRAGAGRPCGRT